MLLRLSCVVTTCLMLWRLCDGRGGHSVDDGERRVCQEITIPMCMGIGYNYTYMPNHFNHDTQDEAGLEVHQFWPLVEIKCSPDLKQFLCSMYTPICMETYNKPIPACRSVCERAKAGCAPIMQTYGFAWPELMRCDKLPRLGDKDTLCMNFNSTEDSNSNNNNNNNDQRGNNKPTALPPDMQRPHGPIANRPVDGTVAGRPDCACKCNHVPIVNKSHPLFDKITTGGEPNCAIPCKGSYFNADERKFTRFWIGLWSVLCCISTFITVLTFLIDMRRFKYPERPIIFLSACYALVSIGYIIRLVTGHEAVACENDIIRYNTTGPALCTVVFLLIYFFGMASSIWWVILSFTWFLSAGLKWGQEAIERYSQYFHLAAWLIPSIKSIAILAMSSVDGDPVSGICYVGNQSIANLRGFVLIPLAVYLLVGCSFLTAGFIAMCRIRRVIRQQGRAKSAVLEKLMVRIGVFSALYTVPAIIVIGCYFYEQHFKEQWEKSHNCNCGQAYYRPDYSVFMLKYFMCLVVGITSGFWVWSGKTIDSWRRVYGRCCGKNEYAHPPRMQKYAASPCPTPAPSGKQMPLSHV